jgi:hypothetical protein
MEEGGCPTRRDKHTTMIPFCTSPGMGGSRHCLVRNGGRAGRLWCIPHKDHTAKKSKRDVVRDVFHLSFCDISLKEAPPGHRVEKALVERRVDGMIKTS